MLAGLLLGMLCGVCLWQLGVLALVRADGAYGVFAAAGALLALTRLRTALIGLTACLTAALLVVSYTPLVVLLLPGVTQRSPLARAPAIVSLSTTVHRNGDLNSQAQERVLYAYELLRGGWARALVVTDAVPPVGPEGPTVRAQMRSLGLSYPLFEVGPVKTTRDEARLAARLARQHGWKQVILVTQAWHMRRAAAVFRGAGLSVICAPAPDGDVDLQNLNGPESRLHVFGLWLHEYVGYYYYRLRGWIK